MPDCWFYFSDKKGIAHLIQVKNNIVYCEGRHKELKQYDDGFCDLFQICEMLAGFNLKIDKNEN